MAEPALAHEDGAETSPEPEPGGPSSAPGRTDDHPDDHTDHTDPIDHPDDPGHPVRRSRRTRTRARRLIVALAVLAAVGGAAAAGLGLGDRGSHQGKAGQLPPATATVTRQTLKDSRAEDGSLGYGTSVSAVGRVPGTVTRLPESGEEITRGKALYRVDDRPVVLMYGAVPAYRTLRTGDEGADVEELERNLRALGYGGFTADDTYTDATADAVKEWQDDQGLDQTGAVELGRVVFAPSAVRVDALDAEEGAATGPGQKVLSYTATAQAVTVELDTADQRLARAGAKVAVELPDGTTVDGRVSDVSTEIIPGSGADEDPTTKVKVLVALDGTKAQQAAAPYVLASVHVSFTAGERKDVLTVPVAALVALPQGGFGVEVVKGTHSSYVPVDTGLFADGRVEISGAGITAGTKVGMPA